MIQEGVNQYGMVSLIRPPRAGVEGEITTEEALRVSSSPHELSLRLCGIQASSDTTWNRFERQDTAGASGGTKAPF
jgi:hypothetical protein